MRRNNAILGVFAAVAMATTLSCPTPSDPAPAPDYHVSFKLDGVLVQLDAGPTGTALAQGGGSISFEGLPSAFQEGTDTLTQILASETSADIGADFKTYDLVSDHLRIEFGSLSTGSKALDDGTNGVMKYDGDKMTDGATYTGSLTVTSYGSIGDSIVGTFYATLGDGSFDYAVTEGSFRVKRYPAIKAGS